MPVRILHVDLDAFFVEVCRQRQPELREVELLVVGGRRESRGVVQSASYGARRYGVRAGMPIAEAARRCPGATFVKGRFPDYRDASRAVHTVLRRHSPVVAMASLDEAYLDYSGTERLWPVSLLPEAEAIRDGVRAATGLDCSVGIGPNRMVAKLASDHAKPRGLMEVRAGWEEGFLAGLELRALPGVGPRTAERWTRLGLTRVAEVQAMRLEELERRVGESAKWLKLRAHGHGGTALRAARVAKSVSRETTFARDLREPGEARRVLDLLAARVTAQLREEGVEARTLTLKIRWDDFTTRTRSRTLGEPTALEGEVLPAARALLEPAIAEALRARHGIRLLGIAATNLLPAGPADLFEAPGRQRQRALSGVLDRVRGRYGFDAIAPGHLVDRPDGRRED
ncbi:MAG TPA: DNA polymerase IV [Gemmatimonadales bacterium]|nr:DNA polymerase IV [Gemmatimonadales bacterium]